MSEPGSSRYRRPVLRKFLRGMRRLGVTVDAFITVREGESPSASFDADDSLTFGFLTASDIDEMLRLEPHSDRTKQLERFADGKLCYGVKDGSQVIAKMWCDLEEYNYKPNYRKLSEDEAYLFSAYADPARRGQNLAPLMRVACYTALNKRGRTRFLSFTNYFNNSARRFKSKLGARNEELRLYVELFGLWSTTVTMKVY